jgi:hypothetical protein
MRMQSWQTGWFRRYWIEFNAWYPSFGSGDDGLGISLPDEHLGITVVRRDEAVDRFFAGEDGGDYPALELTLGERVATALSQEQEVRVKWKIQRGCGSAIAAPWRACARHDCRGSVSLHALADDRASSTLRAACIVVVPLRL